MSRRPGSRSSRPSGRLSGKNSRQLETGGELRPSGGVMPTIGLRMVIVMVMVNGRRGWWWLLTCSIRPSWPSAPGAVCPPPGVGLERFRARAGGGISALPCWQQGIPRGRFPDPPSSDTTTSPISGPAFSERAGDHPSPPSPEAAPGTGRERWRRGSGGPARFSRGSSRILAGGGRQEAQLRPGLGLERGKRGVRLSGPHPRPRPRPGGGPWDGCVWLMCVVS